MQNNTVIEKIKYNPDLTLNNIRDGVYSEFDSKILYQVILEKKPRCIVDFAPRTGKTASVIVEALTELYYKFGHTVDYFIFEKDREYYNDILLYLKRFIFIRVKSDLNIINCRLLKYIHNIDFLFIDANHDYLLAKWYIETLLPKLSPTGIIHIHDQYYNKNQNKWEDITWKAEPCLHPDVINVNTLKDIYGEEFFNKYFENNPVIEKYEGDVVKEYFENNTQFKLLSTTELAQKLNISDSFACSLYLEKIHG